VDGHRHRKGKSSTDVHGGEVQGGREFVAAYEDVAVV